MTVEDAVADVVSPVAESLGLKVYDIEMSGPTLKISLDRPGGVDLDALTDANRAIGNSLDLADPIPGRYTLEVTSPGLERKLRTPAHFKGALGESVKVKLRREVDGRRRLTGVLRSSSDDRLDIVVDGSPEPIAVAVADIESARTTFEWGPQPKPGSAKSGSKKGRKPSVAATDGPTTEESEAS